jgi:hypothetical protein
MVVRCKGSKHCLNSRLTDGGALLALRPGPQFTLQKHYFSPFGTNSC